MLLDVASSPLDTRCQYFILTSFFARSPQPGGRHRQQHGTGSRYPAEIQVRQFPDIYQSLRLFQPVGCWQCAIENNDCRHAFMREGRSQYPRLLAVQHCFQRAVQKCQQHIAGFFAMSHNWQGCHPSRGSGGQSILLLCGLCSFHGYILLSIRLFPALCAILCECQQFCQQPLKARNLLCPCQPTGWQFLVRPERSCWLLGLFCWLLAVRFWGFFQLRDAFLQVGNLRILVVGIANSRPELAHWFLFEHIGKGGHDLVTE